MWPEINAPIGKDGGTGGKGAHHGGDGGQGAGLEIRLVPGQSYRFGDVSGSVGILPLSLAPIHSF